MTNDRPVTPPPELVRKWNQAAVGTHFEPYGYSEYIAAQAARWGADQELEACCQALYSRYDIPNCIPPKVAEEMRDWLRTARRPKPPSLKELALESVKRFEASGEFFSDQMRELEFIRKALEQLDD